MHKPDDNEADLQLGRTIPLANEAATIALATSLAARLKPGFLLYLSGELGSGKTTLVRGILRALGYTGRVKSPTYTLVELYTISRLNLYHFDFYRFRDPKEWDEAGFREHFDGDDVCIVEWPEKASGLLPPADLEIFLKTDASGRLATFTAHTRAGIDCVSGLKLPDGYS